MTDSPIDQFVARTTIWSSAFGNWLLDRLNAPQSDLISIFDVEAETRNVLSGISVSTDVAAPSNSTSVLTYDSTLNKFWSIDLFTDIATRHDIDGTTDGVTANIGALTNAAVGIVVRAGTLWAFRSDGLFYPFSSSDGTSSGPAVDPFGGAGTGITGATLGPNNNVFVWSRPQANTVRVFDIGAPANNVDPISPAFADVTMTTPTALAWDGSNFWISGQNNIAQFTPLMEATGLTLDRTTNDAGIGITWITSNNTLASVTPSNQDRIWIYNRVETASSVLTKEDSNIAFLAEPDGELSLPGGITATVTSILDDDSVAVTSTSSIPSGVLNGPVERVNTIGDSLKAVRVSPTTLVALRP